MPRTSTARIFVDPRPLIERPVVEAGAIIYFT